MNALHVVDIIEALILGYLLGCVTVALAWRYS